ncbi:MAG: helix-turn-helix transcriptional regulator [Bacteroidota bacterium]
MESHKYIEIESEIPNESRNLLPKDYFLGKNLFYLRKSDERKLTQLQLGEMLGVSDSTVSHYEKSKGFPEVKVLLQIQQIFKVNLHALFFSDLSKDKEKSADPDYLHGTMTTAEIEKIVKDLSSRVSYLENKVD